MGAGPTSIFGSHILDLVSRPARCPPDDGYGTPEGWTPARRAQIDRDGRWTLKRGRRRPPPEGGAPSERRAVEIAVPIFGYKSHLGIDRTHGLIRTWTVTHAA